MTHHGSHAFWRKATWLGCSGTAGAGAPPPGTLSWESWRLAAGTRGACGARGPVTCSPCGPTLARGGVAPKRPSRPLAFSAVPGPSSPSSAASGSASAGAAAADFIAMKMSIGLPSVTTSSAAGIWLEILAFGSGGCGCSWPIVSFFSRRIFSASAWFLPTTLGTWTLPLPIAISSATSESFFAFSPAAGVCPMTVPGGASVLTFSFGAGASLRFAFDELLLGLERGLLRP